MKKQSLISKILLMEWEQFSSTNNIGGQAPCQAQKSNFIVSRRAYWSMYNDNVLSSYLHDLEEAVQKKANLVTYKYAYMMQYTDPDYFNKIKDKLPAINAKKTQIINSIMIIYMYWENQIKNENPNLDNKNRLLYSSSDTKYITSVETYMKGELSSYSINTLSEILSFFLQSIKEQLNPVSNYLGELQTFEKNTKYTDKTLNNINTINKDFSLNLCKSLELIDICKQLANESNLKLVISIVDSSSNIIAIQKMDDSLLASIDISLLKAKTSVNFKIATNDFLQNKTLNKVNTLYSKANEYCFIGGGYPIFYNNKLIGALGISGATEKEDSDIAKKAVEIFTKKNIS